MKPGILLIAAGLIELFVVDALNGPNVLFWIGGAVIVFGVLWDIRRSEREQREAIERTRARDAGRSREAA